MKQMFEITAFRNIGFKDGKPCASPLVLSNSTEKGKMGELLVLVGANNSGKSNVLDALETYEKGEYQETDISYMFRESECRAPALTVAYTNNDEDREYLHTLNSYGNNEIYFPDYEKEESTEDYEVFGILVELSKLEKQLLEKVPPFKYRQQRFQELEKNICRELGSIINDANMANTVNVAIEQFKRSISTIDLNFHSNLYNVEQNLKRKYYGWDESKQREEYNALIKKLTLEDEMQKEQAYKRFVGTCIPFLSEYQISYTRQRISDILKTYKTEWKEFYIKVDPKIYHICGGERLHQQDCSKLKEVFEKKLGFSGFRENKIIRYRQVNIDSATFQTSADEIQRNKFYCSLFNGLQTDLDILLNTYRDFRSYGMPAFLKKLETELAEKLKAISAKFNSLYMTNNQPYSFQLELERQGIYFTIYRGDAPQVLEQQSTGFRYFFDMFFNLLCTTELKPGTILIMDEPAANLHVKGQRELRAFLKEFALLNDITIIVATHSPFLIDMDNLDELRVIANNNDGTARIVNDFTAVDPTDPDTLRPIKDALTVENYMLVNPKATVVFVSSLAEYNLLVAFKKLFGKEDIFFLPFNLGGADEQSCMEASKGLQKIRSDAFVVVPDDEAGRLMKSVNGTDTEGNSRSDLEVIFWKEIDSFFTTVNSLFSQNNKNQLFPEGIDSSSTTVFKNHVGEYESKISEKTRENFQKVFSYFE